MAWPPDMMFGDESEGDQGLNDDLDFDSDDEENTNGSGETTDGYEDSEDKESLQRSEDGDVQGSGEKVHEMEEGIHSDDNRRPEVEVGELEEGNHDGNGSRTVGEIGKAEEGEHDGDGDGVVGKVSEIEEVNQGCDGNGIGRDINETAKANHDKPISGEETEEVRDLVHSVCEDESFAVSKDGDGVVNLRRKSEAEVKLDPRVLFGELSEDLCPRLIRLFERRPSTFRYLVRFRMMRVHYLVGFSSFLSELEKLVLEEMTEEHIQQFQSKLDELEESHLDVGWIGKRLNSMLNYLKCQCARQNLKEIDDKLMAYEHEMAMIKQEMEILRQKKEKIMAEHSRLLSLPYVECDLKGLATQGML